MSRPTAIDVYEFLEGYGIDKDLLSVPWVEKRITSLVIPWIQKHTRLNFSSEQTIIEYLSGNGQEILMLSSKPVNELVSIEYVRSENTLFNLANMVELDKNGGMLIAKTNPGEGEWNNVFQKGNKNIKVTYKTGYDDFIDPNTNTIADDVKEAIIMMTAKQALILIGARTGGGALSVQSHSRNYGDRGKYTDIINNIDMMSYEILKDYMTGVAGT